MSDFVIRRGMHGRLSYGIEHFEVINRQNERPLERYSLTAEQSKSTVDELIKLASDNKLTRWTPPQKEKTLAEQNAAIAKEATKKAD